MLGSMEGYLNSSLNYPFMSHCVKGIEEDHMYPGVIEGFLGEKILASPRWMYDKDNKNNKNNKRKTIILKMITRVIITMIITCPIQEGISYIHITSV